MASEIRLVISAHAFYSWQEHLLCKVMRMDFARKNRREEYFIYPLNIHISYFQKVIFVRVSPSICREEGLKIAEDYRQHFVAQLDEEVYRANLVILKNNFLRIIDDQVASQKWRQHLAEVYANTTSPSPQLLLQEMDAYSFEKFCKFSKRTLALSEVWFYDDSFGLDFPLVD